MKNNLTIVFIGFDGYSDLWDDCFNLYNRFWKDRKYRTILVNNTKDVHYDGVEVLHAGEDAEWSKKVQLAIKECRTKYICLLLEDFFIGKEINSNEVEDTMNLIEEDNILYYKLTNLNRKNERKNKQYKQYKYLHMISKSDEYGISLQPAIWDVEYFKDLLGKDNYNAWIFEFNRVKEADINSKEEYLNCVYDERNILNIKHGVVQGKFIPKTIKYFKSIDYELNIKREVLSNYENFKREFITRMKYLIPKKFRKKTKQKMEKIGMKFVSTVRDK